MSDPAVLERLVRDAGFTDVAVKEVATPARFNSPEEHFEVVSGLAGPLSAALVGADDDSLAAIRATTAQAVDRFRTVDGPGGAGAGLALHRARCQLKRWTPIRP
jgi:hypothetical protein